MCLTRRTLAAALLLAMAACGGKHDASPDAGTSSYALTLVGSANLVLHPSDKRTLQVLLAQDQVGPVAGAGVHFEFQDGDGAGAKLDLTDVTTDATGVATVHFTAGTRAGTTGALVTYKLVATAPSYGPDPVAFSFNVIPVRRLIQIVGSPTTHVDSTGTSATAILPVSTSANLTVREMDADTGTAIANDAISFTLPPAALSSGDIYWTGSTASTTATTNSGGQAQATLFTKGSGGPWLVTAQAAGGGAAVTFSVTVQNYGTSCTSNSQCPTGEICAGSPPTCQAGGAGTGCNNGTDNPCPFGYICDPNGVCQPPSGNQCDPAPPNCASGQCCNGSNACVPICATPCAAGTHCQPGATCGTGQCVSDVTTPDVTGIWLTRHDYSIAQALPTALRDVFYAIRVLDQALLGKLTIPGLPSWLQAIINSFISGLLQQYLPDWLQQVIHISDDLVTILSNLRSEGSMHLVAGVDYQHVNGTEVWTSLVFYWLPLCNGNIGGDPAVPPECARIDIATTDSSNPGETGQCKGQSLPSIAVQVTAFTASVAGTGAGGSAPYVLNVDQRKVQLKMGKVVLVLVDYLIQIVTGGQYNCIDEITDCTPGPGNCPLVDCYGISQDLAGPGTWLGGFVDPGTIEGLCDGVVTTAGQAVTTLLANAWDPTADVLDFNGHATVSGAAADPTVCEAGTTTCAAQLGNDNWDKDLYYGRATRDGFWTGDFFFKVINKLPGAWEATRPQ